MITYPLSVCEEMQLPVKIYARKKLHYPLPSKNAHVNMTNKQVEENGNSAKILFCRNLSICLKGIRNLVIKPVMFPLVKATLPGKAA